MSSSNLDNKVTTNSTASLSSIELIAGSPYIDFHFNKSTADYTSRLVEYTSGILTCSGGFNVSGSLQKSGVDVSLSTHNHNGVYVPASYLNGLKIRHSWSGITFTNGSGEVTISNIAGWSSSQVSVFAMVKKTDTSSSYYVTQSAYDVLTGKCSLKLNSNTSITLQVQLLFVGA